MNAKKSTKRYIVTATSGTAKATIVESNSLRQAAEAWRSYKNAEMYDRHDEIVVVPDLPPTYSTVVLSANGRRADGSPSIERSCGHHHKTLETAHRCYKHLAAPLGDGARLAAWYRAVVRRSDGSKLTDEESERWAEIRLAAR